MGWIALLVGGVAVVIYPGPEWFWQRKYYVGRLWRWRHQRSTLFVVAVAAICVSRYI
jgi:hypothetical protein